MYYPSGENKGADQLRGSASLLSHMQNVGFLGTWLICYDANFKLTIDVQINLGSRSG